MYKKTFIVGLIALALIGCMTTAPISQVSQMPKNSDGMLVVVTENVTGIVSAERICAAFPETKDVRCGSEIDKYVGARALTHVTAYGNTIIPVLVPKSAGVGNTDIIKIQIKGNAPAHFIELGAKGIGQPDCYYDGMFGRGTGGSGGVVCPKFNWDYKKDVNR